MPSGSSCHPTRVTDRVGSSIKGGFAAVGLAGAGHGLQADRFRRPTQCPVAGTDRSVPWANGPGRQ